MEGIERASTELAGLPERVRVIRDQDLIDPDAAPPGDANTPVLVDHDGDALNTGTGTGKPAKDLSVNFVPVPWPSYPTARIAMKPGERIGLVAVDGIPLTIAGSAGHAIEWRTNVMISPGARAGIIVTAPPAGVDAMLVTRAVNTGPGFENDPTRALVSITAAASATPPQSSLPTNPIPLPSVRNPWLGSSKPTRTRKLFFSESPDGQQFYLTVDGEKPTAFDPMTTQPNIVVKQGDVEDWIIENRSTELRDTTNIPFYDASMAHFPKRSTPGTRPSPASSRTTTAAPPPPNPRTRSGPLSTSTTSF